MADPRSRLQAVEYLPDDPGVAPEPRPDTAVNLGAQALVIGLGALSKRFLVALSSLWLGAFTISTVFSAWWLWYCIPRPENTQIVALGIYAGFILAINWLVRRV